MPNVDKKCITHHYACDCREATLQRYIRAKEAYSKAWHDETLTPEIIKENMEAWDELKKLKH